jgi:hypothetical protein
MTQLILNERPHASRQLEQDQRHELLHVQSLISLHERIGVDPAID